MNKHEKLQLIKETGVIAIMRARSSEQLIAAADAIKEGGVKVIEVSMTTPGALQLIIAATQRYGNEVLFGAGTVVDLNTAQAAVKAGAGFVVAPSCNPKVISLCRRRRIPVIPGCFTPTEMFAAWSAGADFIKLFPADIGGPDLVKALLAPFPQLQIIPVGGVDLESTAEFIRKGAVAVGVGSSLINQTLIDAGNLAEMTRRAAAFIEAVKKGRGR
jgi:2-dehydro-3-deoxyphosphogluconate aldolase / (4S)-4-hydroxy-2-oxoglutarate aldolase